jgi:chromosome segregation ATPase
VKSEVMLALEELRARRTRAVNDWNSWRREILRLEEKLDEVGRKLDEAREKKRQADRDIREAEDKASDDLGFSCIYRIS